MKNVLCTGELGAFEQYDALMSNYMSACGVSLAQDQLPPKVGSPFDFPLLFSVRDLGSSSDPSASTSISCLLCRILCSSPCVDACVAGTGPLYRRDGAARPRRNPHGPRDGEDHQKHEVPSPQVRVRAAHPARHSRANHLEKKEKARTENAGKRAPRPPPFALLTLSVPAFPVSVVVVPHPIFGVCNAKYIRKSTERRINIMHAPRHFPPDCR